MSDTDRLDFVPYINFQRHIIASNVISYLYIRHSPLQQMYPPQRRRPYLHRCLPISPPAAAPRMLPRLLPCQAAPSLGGCRHPSPENTIQQAAPPHAATVAAVGPTCSPPGVATPRDAAVPWWWRKGHRHDPFENRSKIPGAWLTLPLVLGQCCTTALKIPGSLLSRKELAVLVLRVADCQAEMNQRSPSCPG